MVPSIYEITSLKHSYNQQPVLSVDHLTVKSASIVGLMGPNGSGKSTLLRLLGLIETPTQGEIRFNGRPVEPFSNDARFLITILPQEPFLMKRSVFRNVSYGLKLRGENTDLPARVNEALSLVGLSEKDFCHRPWYALSGGEAQRVALAARLALKPKVLLLDEPTASVDAASAQLIREASLRARRELGTTLIVASHDWQWLYEVCDEILQLFKGQIFGVGHETVVYGPWKEFKPGIWGKQISDHQYLKVPPPPNNNAAAIINNVSISDEHSNTTDGNFMLQGTVSRLNLEKSKGRIFATLIAGNQPFTIVLTPQQTKERTIFPGKSVYIHYNFNHIKWI